MHVPLTKPDQFWTTWTYRGCFATGARSIRQVYLAVGGRA
jgi:hypothetical protein